MIFFCISREDGCEQSNIFDHNLGINAKGVGNEDPNQIIPTDSSPSVFWITNPNNTFTNNAAIGGRFGYWFLMPDKPIGASAGDYALDTYVRPRCQVLGVFDDNVAHGNFQTGFQMDNFLVTIKM